MVKKVKHQIKTKKKEEKKCPSACKSGKGYLYETQTTICNYVVEQDFIMSSNKR